MKKADRKKAIPAAVTAFLLLIAYAADFLPVPEELWVARELFCAAIYIGIISIWGVSVSIRVIHPQMKKLFAGVSGLLVFWVAARTVRYLLPDSDAFKHFLWYLYYIPMLFIPLLTVLIAASLGRPESFRLPRWTGLLFLAAAGLFLLVLTNDLHQLVFVFPVPVGVIPETEEYRYGAGYFLAAGWGVGGVLATLGILFSRSRLPGKGRRMLAPVVLTAALFLYMVLYAVRLPLVFLLLRDMTVVEGLLTVSILETCLRTGLIQANTHYAELFRSSGIRAVIVDEDYGERISSEAYLSLPKELLKKAENGPVMLDSDLRLSSAPIRNGRVLWQEDISEVTALLEELREVNERLAEDNDLLRAEDEMKQRRARVAEQDRLYDKVAREVLPQLQVLDEMLSGKAETPPREKLKLLCVYGTYIKRRCNLLLLGEDARICPAAELEYCVRESCEALSAAGVDCSFRRSFAGELPIQTAILLYDLIQELVESVLPSLSAFYLNMTVAGGQAELKLLADHREELPAEWKGLEALHALGGVLELTREEGGSSAALYLPKGGAAG